MSLSKSFRWVAVGNLQVRNAATSPNGAPKFTLNDLMEAAIALQDLPDGRRSYYKDDLMMWFDKIQFDETYYVGLFQVGDKTVADPAFINLTNMQKRTAEKSEEEGGHFCAHVLIAATPDKFGGHLILIERVPGVSPSTIASHLNWLLAKKDQVKTLQTGDGPKTYRGVVEIDGYQSKTLKHAMTTGKVLDVTLVGHQNLDKGHDEVPFVQETERQLCLKVGRQLDGDEAQKIIKTGIRWVRGWQDCEDGSGQLLVRFKSDEGQTKTVSVDAGSNGLNNEGAEEELASLAAKDALQSALTLNEIISGFDKPLTQNYDDIREDVVVKLRDCAGKLAG